MRALPNSATRKGVVDCAVAHCTAVAYALDFAYDLYSV